MIGLFQELGPCGVGPDMKPFNNPYSWTNASNMLFIDEPTTVGLSYSIPIPGYKDGSTIVQLPNATCPDYAQNYGTCGTFSKPDLTLTANTTEGAAPNMWKTLQGFMGAFPQYSRNGFSFTTESYGGRNFNVRIARHTLTPYRTLRAGFQRLLPRSEREEHHRCAQDRARERPHR
jgi:carboxypeptidase C (cathepsin A)